MSEANQGRRLAVVGLIVAALFTGLLTKLWFLQVAGGQELAVAAERNGDKIVQIPAIRGRILDANGEVLAETKAVTSLVVDRASLDDTTRVKLVANLAKLLGLDPAVVAAKVNDPKYPPYQSVPVVNGVSPEIATALVEHSTDYPHASLENSYVREYPQGSLAAHAVGYVGRIDETEYEARKADGYQRDDIIGKAGAEKIFETELRGTPELERVQINNEGLVIGSSIVRKAVPGRDVQLTVDDGVQRIAETSLQQGIDGARSNGKTANAGAVVVLDARTGAVVALASNPSYDPNLFAQGTAPDAWFDQNGPLPLIDRALNPYAPGSTFKMITSVAALGGPTPIIDPNESFYDDGCFELGNNEKRCNATDGRGNVTVNGWVNLSRALTVSSDWYFYRVGNNIWNDYRNEGGDAKTDATAHPSGYRIQNTAKLFGFGTATGIGLVGDQTGRIPDLQFNISLNKTNPDPTSRTWRRGDSASIAVGQGDVLVTPLQLANAYATFANGGTLFTPRIASKVLTPGVGLPAGKVGEVVHSLDPMTVRTGVVSPDIRATILPGLEGAVNEGDGTAYPAFQGYQGPPVAGKTGTAQIETKGVQDTSWFVGFTNPANDPSVPQFVVLSMVEQGGFGADVSAPIVRRIMDFLAGNPNPAPVHVAGQAANHD
jgi:penicillin-binding protein 2